MENDLLLEVGVEEIPSHYLSQTLSQLREKSARLLKTHRLPYEAVSVMCTPRRLVLHVRGLADKQEALVREVQGPPKAAPAQAAQAFATSQGVSVQSLKAQKTPRGEYLFAQVTEKRRASAGILKELLPELLSSFSFPKSMRWNESGVRFVRPLRWILALYGDRVIRFKYGGVMSGNLSYGHPLMRPGSFVVKKPSTYWKELARRFVVVDQDERESIILKQIQILAKARKGKLQVDKALVEQNGFQTEYPVALCGGFDKAFLQLPQEVLINVMGEQQGYFTLYGPGGRLLPYFICVADVRAKKMDVVQKGHERVLRARLEDARFYFEEDQKRPLLDRVDDLKGVTFHERLGTLHEKMRRIERLSTFLAKSLEPECHDRLQRAARLCKADLLTGMVREFPALQGVMGREYARLQGEDEEVSRAIFEHYLPRWASDPSMPKSSLSKFLALADKIDTITGFFAVGLRPSGSEDPYALRRLGQGVVRILLDQVFIGLSLDELVGLSLSALGEKVKGKSEQVKSEIMVFLRERLQAFIKLRASGQGGREDSAWFGQGSHRADLVDAVLLHRFDYVAQAYRRIVSLVIFHKREEFDPLMVGFKRAARIVPSELSQPVQADLLKQKEEKALFDACRVAADRVKPLIEAQKYEETLGVLAALRQPIDAFFEEVFVMDEDIQVRNNRLALLKSVCDLFNQYADFSLVTVS